MLLYRTTGNIVQAIKDANLAPKGILTDSNRVDQKKVSELVKKIFGHFNWSLDIGWNPLKWLRAIFIDPFRMNRVNRAVNQWAQNLFQGAHLSKGTVQQHFFGLSSIFKGVGEKIYNILPQCSDSQSVDYDPKSKQYKFIINYPKKQVGRIDSVTGSGWPYLEGATLFAGPLVKGTICPNTRLVTFKEGLSGKKQVILGTGFVKVSKNVPVRLNSIQIDEEKTEDPIKFSVSLCGKNFTKNWNLETFSGSFEKLKWSN